MNKQLSKKQLRQLLKYKPLTKQARRLAEHILADLIRRK